MRSSSWTWQIVSSDRSAPEVSGSPTSSSSRPAATCATPSPTCLSRRADARARHGQRRPAEGCSWRTGWTSAILRVTPAMVARPSARMEPSAATHGAHAHRRRVDEDDAHVASLLDLPLAVFGDPIDSGTYNAYGEYLTALEQDLEVTMRWLGTPGAFSHCLAYVRRADPPLRHLEFLSYAERYAAAGLPTRRPRECQPYYPWSLAWRDDDTSDATVEFLRVAQDVSSERGWLDLSGHAPPGCRQTSRSAPKHSALKPTVGFEYRPGTPTRLCRGIPTNASVRSPPFTSRCIGAESSTFSTLPAASFRPLSETNGSGEICALATPATTDGPLGHGVEPSRKSNAAFQHRFGGGGKGASVRRGSHVLGGDAQESGSVAMSARICRCAVVPRRSWLVVTAATGPHDIGPERHGFWSSLQPRTMTLPALPVASSRTFG